LIIDLGLDKLEVLYFDSCHPGPTFALISRFGHALTKLHLIRTTGAIDCLKIIDLCPNLEELDVGGIMRSLSDNQGVHSFDSGNFYIQNPPMKLKYVKMSLNNPYGVELPPGAIARYV